MRHVVWDWNGTLFDDLEVVLEAVNEGLASVGAGPIDLDGYRSHYTRPVRVFYDRVVGRPVTDEEWRNLDARFHRGYLDLLDRARPHGDALAALELTRSKGHRQSLLSMFPHHELVPLVDRLGLSQYFDRVDGLTGAPGDRKAAYLEAHLGRMLGDTPPDRVLVVGDTPDDAAAAVHVGAECVLLHTGAHHREELEACGVRVVDHLVEAVAGW